MESNNSRHPNNPQPIPLQDLSRPPDSQEGIDGDRRGSRSGRNLLRPDRRYSRLQDASPSPMGGRGRIPQPYVTSPSGHQSSPYGDDDQGIDSPTVDGSAFQDALPSDFGLSFQPASLHPSSYNMDRTHPQRQGSDADGMLSPLSQSRRATSEPDGSFGYGGGEITPTSSPDRSRDPSPSSQAFNRSSFQSVRFTTPDSHRTARLGDDLPGLESGISPKDGMGRKGSRHQRSLSPGSAGASTLYRAGSMVRKMSQRVVNLSNEPEIVEQSIRRRSSVKLDRMDAPPDIPAIGMYACDEPQDGRSMFERGPQLSVTARRQLALREQSNPLKGKTLEIFSPENSLRRALCSLLVHPATEPIILVLIVIQTILLAIDAAPNVTQHPRPQVWGSSWIDYCILGLFILYSLEIIAKVIVSGLVLNPAEYSSIDRSRGYWVAFQERIQDLFTPQGQQPVRQMINPFSDPVQPSILRSFTAIQAQGDMPGHSRYQQRVRLARRAFLRHSFNRVDFVAVISFWISFLLGTLQLEGQHHLYVFRMLSCLRIIRLLGLTSGTSVILRSLKKAAPLLVNVAFLIGFFWLLFAIVGVQSFKASFRRSCTWIDPMDHTNTWINPTSFCGGHLNNVTGLPEPWLQTDGLTNGAPLHKGFLCPQGSICIEQSNLANVVYNGTVSFDNVLQSLQLVFVIMSANTFSDLLYYTTQSDYLAAALFFAGGIVIMSLWLMNLLVAVITSSFQVIREESKASAFAADEITEPVEEEEEPLKRVGGLKRLYDKTSWVWIIIILYGLVVQCLRSANMGPTRTHFINNSETVVTILLLAEIVIRFSVGWRDFFRSKQNVVDLILALVTMVIQIPYIRNSGQPYAWLTFFQIIRIYRVVMAVPLTRDLILKVLGNVTGLLNLIVFVFLLTFLAAIFAVQIFRGQLPDLDSNGNTIAINFNNIYNAFLGMYQILSSENWTAIMYTATTNDKAFNTAWIGASFFILWFILANFIVLNMFIAVIQENFDVSEDEKRLQQVKMFLQQKEMSASSQGNLSLSAIFKVGSRSRKDPLNYEHASMEMLLKEAVVKDFLDDQEPLIQKAQETPTLSPAPYKVPTGRVSNWWAKLQSTLFDKEPNPFYAKLQFSRAYEDLDARTLAAEVVAAKQNRVKAQREYLRKYPNYNVALFIFGPDNPIRRCCQYIVGPGRGSQRAEGVEPIKWIWYSFSAFIYCSIVAMVLLACITTPLYQKEYFAEHGFHLSNWFVFTDMGFAILFSVEAIIKVLADGFFWTPNAYFRGSWGFIDGVVLLTLWVNVATQLHNEGAVSRAVGAFKALRALRLLNVSDSARETFHSVIVLGGWKVLSAAFVSISLLIPFAILGLNIFNGQLQLCNDSQSGISNLADCVGEFPGSPYNWNVWSPRVVHNPYYDFDNFGGSISILFQIVSQEGWIDVQWASENIVGRGLQPQPYASQGNAMFFVIFNLLGSVFVLTLFVSVFMRNYTEQTGVAFLTADQRSWLELRKLLRQIAPSKRPSYKAHQTIKNWCYRQSTHKHGIWQRIVTAVLIAHLVLLILEWYPGDDAWDHARDYIFLVFTLIYIANIVIRIVGLTWPRFRRSSWDLYSIASVSGTFITTVLLLSNFSERAYVQLHKLFLVSIALLLIPRNNQLDQLFKTAAASLSAIGNLLATWFVLFLVFAIALTQTFGLTRFGNLENGNLNFRTVPKALILLFRMSCGESWNQIMEDFANIREPNCNANPSFFDNDCGSAAWARGLFISWNILSMYIFVSLFVSLIFESFSYVYQRSSGLAIISREEIRRFKQAWSEFDPDGTGYISKEAFPRLLRELSGLFDMRIYDGEFSVTQILEDCRQEPTMTGRESGIPPVRRQSGLNSPGIVDGVDLARLSRRISQIPVHEIRRRRAKMNKFYEEVLVSSDPDRGISFTTLLMVIAHYNVISDNKSLQLDEYLRRRARLTRVDEAVKRNVVIGFFDTMYWSRRFRQAMATRRAGRMAGVPTFAVPEIFVDDEDATTGVEGNQNPFGGDGASDDGVSPGTSQLETPIGSRPSTPSNAGDRPFDRSPQLSPHRANFSTGFESHGGWGNFGATSSGATVDPAREHSRQGSSVSAQDVLEVLDNSAWGESIRRSFTMRRPSRSPG